MKQNELERLAIVETEIKDLKNKVDAGFASLNDKLDKVIEGKADKDDFTLWRNILISGILLSTFLGVVALIFDKYVK